MLFFLRRCIICTVTRKWNYSRHFAYEWILAYTTRTGIFGYSHFNSPNLPPNTIWIFMLAFERIVLSHINFFFALLTSAAYSSWHILATIARMRWTLMSTPMQVAHMPSSNWEFAQPQLLACDCVDYERNNERELLPNGLLINYYVWNMGTVYDGLGSMYIS